MYKTILRPLFFLFDPEKIHHVTFALIKIVSKIPGIPFIFRSLYQVNDKRLERNVFGLTFKNPVGLAAGFDKNAVLYLSLYTSDAADDMQCVVHGGRRGSKKNNAVKYNMMR